MPTGSLHIQFHQNKATTLGQGSNECNKQMALYRPRERPQEKPTFPIPSQPAFSLQNSKPKPGGLLHAGFERSAQGHMDRLYSVPGQKTQSALDTGGGTCLSPHTTYKLHALMLMMVCLGCFTPAHSLRHTVCLLGDWLCFQIITSGPYRVQEEETCGRNAKTTDSPWSRQLVTQSITTLNQPKLINNRNH